MSVGGEGEYRKLKTLFNRLTVLDPREQRSELDDLRIGEPALAKQLEQMLVHDAEFVDHTAKPITTAIQVSDPLIGTDVGAFRVKRLLGQGGMGSVYFGERNDGRAEQQVAIKVLHQLISNSRDLTRFQHERETLSRLDHRYIARLVDAQELPNGRPYMVMDYVDGVPIDQYCQTNHLDIEARLRMFLALCEGVDHAHRNLVIHRDIKPSNVLIAADGTPRLLDFGIAKSLSLDAELTQQGDQLFSPHFASPEQLNGEPLGVATDIYSLGALLYQLLAEVPMYDWGSMGVAEKIRAIAGTTPELPSVRAASKNLRKTVKGDLDAIVMKCLRKEPSERYRSVQDIENDVRNYLTSKPVVARRGSRWYRIRRFSARNRALVMVSMAAAAIVAVSLVALWQQRVRADAQRVIAQSNAATAQSTVDFLVGTFEIASPEIGLGPETKVGKLFQQAVKNLSEEDLSEDRLLATRLRLALARALFQAQHFDLLAEVLETVEEADLDPELAGQYAFLRANVSLHANDIESMHDGIDSALVLDGVSTALRHELLLLKARAHHVSDDQEAARLLIRQVVDESSKRDRVFYEAKIRLSAIEYDLGNRVEAKSLAEEISRSVVTDYPGDNSVQLAVMEARFYAQLADIRSVEALDRFADMTRNLYGEDTQGYLSALTHKANQLGRLGHESESLELSREVLARTVKEYGSRHPRSAKMAFNVGLQGMKIPGQEDEGLAHLRDAVSMGEQAWPPEQFNLHFFGTVLGIYLVRQELFAEAKDVLEKSTGIANRVPDFQRYETHPEGEISYSIALYAQDPTQENRQRAQSWLDIGSQNGETMRDRLKIQIEVAERLGLALKLLPVEESPSD